MGSLKGTIDNAICLAVSMLAGAFIGSWLFNPIITSSPDEGWSQMITGMALGTIAGAIAWKVYAAYNPMERSSDSQ